MDILIHSASGLLVGSVFVHTNQPKSIAQRALILFTGAAAGAIPDLDVISLWSGFDSTIGKWFELQEPGRQIYSGKHWYSHHGFSHSIFCAALLCFFILGIRQMVYLGRSIKSGLVYIYAFFGGYMAHLLGDLPTPPGAWGGIRLFYPSEQYVGGWALTWWWNNYDIFLIVVTASVINVLLLFLRLTKFKRLSCAVATSMSLIAFALCCTQLLNRGEPFDYARGSGQYNSREERSKVIQKQVLGEEVYQKMLKFDNSISVNF